MNRHRAGFTLIELMVVLAIMAVLLAAGIPYTRAWVDSNRQMQARNVLWEAVTQARTLAMRNPDGVDAAATAASLKLDGAKVQVFVTDKATPAWSGSLPANATVKLLDTTGTTGAALTCVAFNNRGHRLSGAAGCGTNATQTRLAIGLRTQDPLYVDLL